jgi:hypothetical protein
MSVQVVIDFDFVGCELVGEVVEVTDLGTLPGEEVAEQLHVDWLAEECTKRRKWK